MMTQRRTIHFFIALISIYCFIISCGKEQFVPYDNPFFHIHVNNSDSVRIQDTRNETIDYKVYLSSKKQFEPITLNYAIIPGNGLTEGLDYELITKGSSIVFSPGIVERTITIRWIPRTVDPSKNNSLTIKLLESNKDFNIGLPGPDKKQSSLKIIKF